MKMKQKYYKVGDIVKIYQKLITEEDFEMKIAEALGNKDFMAQLYESNAGR